MQTLIKSRRCCLTFGKRERERVLIRLFPNKAKLHPDSFQAFEDSCFDYDRDETTSEIHFAILGHFLKPYVQRLVFHSFMFFLLRYTPK